MQGWKWVGGGRNGPPWGFVPRLGGRGMLRLAHVFIKAVAPGFGLPVPMLISRPFAVCVASLGLCGLLSVGFAQKKAPQAGPQKGPERVLDKKVPTKEQQGKGASRNPAQTVEVVPAPGLGQRELHLLVGQALPLGPEGPEELVFEGKAWMASGDFQWGSWFDGDKDVWTVRDLAEWKAPQYRTCEDGQTLVYRAGADTWGMLRVLERTEGSVRLEQVVLTQGESLSMRSPLALAGGGEPDGNRLSWNANSGVTYQVTRKLVGSTESGEVLAEVNGSTFLDVQAPGDQLLEYIVQVVGGPPAPAARLRMARQELPGDWPLELEIGLGLDLLTGATHGPNPHLEVHQIIGSQVLVRASANCPIATPGKYSSGDEWQAPAYSERTYMPRIRSVEIGASVFYYLTEFGVYGRLNLQQDEQGRVFLLRSLDLGGGRWLPKEPELLGWDSGSQGLSLEFEPVPKGEADQLPTLERIIEWERLPGSGDWETLVVQPVDPYQAMVSITPKRPDLPLVHLRFRHRSSATNASIPSEPVPLLALDSRDTKVLSEVQKRALQALASEDFEERFLGEHVLRGLGASAWPALLDIYSNKGGVPGDLARQILLSPEGLAGGQLQEVIRIAGAHARLPDPFPAAWFCTDGDERLMQILLDHGRQDTLGWLDLSLRMDPDIRVREMARLLLAAPAVSRPFGTARRAGFDGIFTMIPEATRSERPWPDWAYELEGADPLDAAAAIRASVALGRVLEAHSLLALARLVEAPDVLPAQKGPSTLERALLGLGMVELYRKEKRTVLMDAVREGVVSGGPGLMAWRDLMEQRFSSPTDGSLGARERVRLPEASLAALQQTLADLEVSGSSYVDVILPEGTYTAQAGLDSWLDLQVRGLALLGEGNVQLQVGLRAEKVDDLVVADMEVHNRGGMALVLTGASMTMRGVRMRGAQSPVTLQDSILEMEACRILQSQGKGSSVAIRMLGPSLVLARGCLSEAGAWVLGDQGMAYIERSLIDSRGRPLFQGQRGGQLVLRDSVLMGGSAGFQGLQSVWLEGVLSTLRNQSLGPQNDAVYVCPEHNHTFEPWLDNVGARELERCPLHTDR